MIGYDLILRLSLGYYTENYNTICRVFYCSKCQKRKATIIRLTDEEDIMHYISSESKKIYTELIIKEIIE
jgi:hypothetical protein